jgi:O-antigen ligase
MSDSQRRLAIGNSPHTSEKCAMRTIAVWLSLILIFMIPWENSVIIAGLGTLTRVTGLFVAAFWVVTVLATGRFRKLHSFHLAAYLFVLWNAVSAFWSFGIEETIQRIKTYFQLVGLALILWDLYTTPATLAAGLQAYVLGACVSTGSTVANYLAGNVVRGAVTTDRYAGAGLDANELALILALGIPVAWHLVTSAGNGKKSYIMRLVNCVYIPAALFATLLTGSRMALFATAPAILFILGTFTRLKLSSRVLVFGALIGALFVLQPLAPQTSFDRLATTRTSIAAGDLGGRVEIWRQGIAVFLEHPLLGVGSGAFPTVVESSTVAHNVFLSVLAEVGMIGFVLFVIVLVMAAYQAKRQPKWDSKLWLTILLVWAIGVSSLTWEHSKPTWLFLSLTVVSASLSGQRDESTPRSEFPVESFGLPSSFVVRRDTSTD